MESQSRNKLIPPILLLVYEFLESLESVCKGKHSEHQCHIDILYWDISNKRSESKARIPCAISENGWLLFLPVLTSTSADIDLKCTIFFAHGGPCITQTERNDNAWHSIRELSDEETAGKTWQALKLHMAKPWENQIWQLRLRFQANLSTAAVEFSDLFIFILWVFCLNVCT